MKLKYIFLDIDNTLFDSKKLAEQARKNAVRAMIKSGLKAKSANSAYGKLKKIIKKFGPNYPRHFNKLVLEYGVNNKHKAKIIAAGVVAYHNTKFRFLTPFPGVKNALRKLRKTGYKLGIISNGRAVKQWDKLIRLGLAEFFEVVVISEEVGAEKPNLKIFRAALKRAKCKPKNAVMIGDKKEDFAARKIGIEVIDIKKIKNFRKILREVSRIS